jgi:hypothetical protein
MVSTWELRWLGAIFCLALEDKGMTINDKGEGLRGQGP